MKDFLQRCAFNMRSTALVISVWLLVLIAAPAVGQVNVATPVREGECAAPESAAECGVRTETGASGDERGVFSATAYLGGVFDNFAPSAVGNYIGTAATEQDRKIFGIDIDVRLLGRADSPRQLWIFGETMHGVRSSDLNCTTQPTPPVCSELKDALTQQPLGSGLYILKHSTTFEGFTGARFEFATLQAGTEFPMRAYASFLGGVMMFTDANNHALAAHSLGVGVLSPQGLFEGSRLEMSWGRTDLFLPQRELLLGAQTGHWNRLKFDGYLTFNVARSVVDNPRVWEKVPHFFIQLYSDFDPRGSDADSIQTFVGLEWDVVDFFGF